ncbi:SDR family NAD(P)-dependent oxidoreductase [Rhodococcus opacus]
MNNAHSLLTTPFTPRSTATDVIEGRDLHGKRVIVTGGSSGLGTETVRALASAGAEVTIATRNRASAQFLVDEFSARPEAGQIHAVTLDLADIASVHAFTRAWEGPVDVLIANAGIMAIPTRQLNERGIELQLATNHVGHFALATGLHENLAAANAARIVAVSSGGHLLSGFDFADPNYNHRPYDRWTAYGQSKTANVLFTVGVTQRWASDGITANALMPGWIPTNLTRHLDDDTMRAMGALDENGKRIVQPHYKTPEQGAATSVLLAVSPALEGISGRYFEDNQEAKPVPAGDGRTAGVAAYALDPESADQLWEYTTSIV